MTVGEHVYFIVFGGDETMKRYLGVDLHRNCFTVCTLKEDGQSELRKWSIHSLGDFAQGVKATNAWRWRPRATPGTFARR